MKVTVDNVPDVLYLCIPDARIHDSSEVKPGSILDSDDQNTLVRVEILRISEGMPTARHRTGMIESA
ncbi:MAG: DUF2283 domain-containing protein [Methanoregula sp.]|nr:DUF2283 domain-containing protein [Methanoregula sp.]